MAVVCALGPALLCLGTGACRDGATDAAPSLPIDSTAPTKLDDHLARAHRIGAAEADEHSSTVAAPSFARTLRVVTPAGDRLVPQFDEPTSAGRLTAVTFARSGPQFSVTDPLSGVGVGAVPRLQGASHASASGAYLVYRFANSSREVLHRPSPTGTEDYIWLEDGESVMEYELELGEKVAALRLVANTLELLGDGGAPRGESVRSW